MKRAAIVSPIRTAVGKYLGALSDMTAGELGAVVLKALVERTGINPEKIDDVIFAQGYANGEAPCIARYSALAAGLPIEIPGYQLDRRCGSGLQAVIDAAMMVQTGVADVVIAGGVESMSNAEYYTTDMRKGARAGSVTMHDRLARGRVMSQPIERFGVISGMIETADNLARDYQISREASDEYAVMSHQRAAAAWAAGKFDDELVPVSVKQKKGDPIVFAMDEGVRADATVESLGKLRPIEKDGVVTAGNASQQNDAAAACLVRVAAVGPGGGPGREQGRDQHSGGEGPCPDDAGLHAPSAVRQDHLLDVRDDERDQDGREAARRPVEQDPGSAGESAIAVCLIGVGVHVVSDCVSGRRRREIESPASGRATDCACGSRCVQHAPAAAASNVTSAQRPPSLRGLPRSQKFRTPSASLP